MAFLGFPLHAPNRPSSVRGEHLMQVSIPMLFLQGTRDALADLRLLQGLVKRLDELATLRVLADADHSFHVLVRSGRTDAQVRGEMLESLVSWIASVIWMIGNWADEDHAGKLRWQRIDPYTRACSKTLYLHLVNGGRRAVAAGPHLGLPGP
ncbi:MAG: alpha/beta family hydrolase [Steroidobacterales bacterium]